MTARRSLAVTLPFLSLAGQTAGPSCTTGRPLPAQSAEVTDNQPAMMHICVSVCAVRKVQSSMPRLSSLNTVYPTHFYTNCTKKIMLLASAESNLDDELSSVCKRLTRVCSKSRGDASKCLSKMISAKQNHTRKTGRLSNMVARNFYLPVNNFPTSHSRTGAFDFCFYESMFYKCCTSQEKLYLAVVPKKAFLTFSWY